MYSSFLYCGLLLLSYNSYYLPPETLEGYCRSQTEIKEEGWSWSYLPHLLKRSAKNTKRRNLPNNLNFASGVEWSLLRKVMKPHDKRWDYSKIMRLMPVVTIKATIRYMECLDNVKDQKSHSNVAGNDRIQPGCAWNKWNPLNASWTERTSFGRDYVVFRSQRRKSLKHKRHFPDAVKTNTESPYRIGKSWS